MKMNVHSSAKGDFIGNFNDGNFNEEMIILKEL